jgi:hypothetical protein
MTTIIEKALRGNNTALPFSRQQKPQCEEFVLWERHLKNTYGLSSSIASAYASIRELEASSNGR